MSTLNGLWTNEGLAQSQIALANAGWKIYPTQFQVADTPGTFDATRVGAKAWQSAHAYVVGNEIVPTSPNGYYYRCTVAGTSSGTEPTWPTTPGNTVGDGGATWTCVGTTSGGLQTPWYTANISSRIAQPPNTIEFILTIPPQVVGSPTNVGEIVLFMEDENGVAYSLILLQPSSPGSIIYNPGGALSLRVSGTIQNVTVSLYTFNYTQATEIGEHNTDPNAHADIRSLIKPRLNLLPNPDFLIDRFPSGSDLSGGNFVYGPEGAAGKLVGTSVSGTLIRNALASIGARGITLKFGGITLSGGAEEVHFRLRVRGRDASVLNGYYGSFQFKILQNSGATIYPQTNWKTPTSGLDDFGGTLVTFYTSPTNIYPVLNQSLYTVLDQGIDIATLLGGDPWQASHAYSLNDQVEPVTINGFFFKCTTAGTSNSSEPSWDTTVGHTTSDGTAVWTCMGAVGLTYGLEIEVVIPVGAISGKDLEITELQLERNQFCSNFVDYRTFDDAQARSFPAEQEARIVPIVLGSAAQIASEAATDSITTLAATLAAGVGNHALFRKGNIYQLTGDLTLSTDDLVLDGEDQTAIIDLNSHSLKFTGNRQVAKNLKVIDSGSGGTVDVSGATAGWFLFNSLALSAVVPGATSVVLCVGSGGGVLTGALVTAPGIVYPTGSTYTVAKGDRVIICRPTGAQQINLPAISGNSGREIHVINDSAYVITIVPNGSENLNGSNTYGAKLFFRYDSSCLEGGDTAWWTRGAPPASWLQGTTTGSANTYVLALYPAPDSLAALDGLPIRVKFNAGNTGDSTLAVAGFTAKHIYTMDGLALGAGALIATNRTYIVMYNAGLDAFLVSNPSFVLPALGTTAGTSTAYTATPTPAWSALPSDKPFTIIFNQTNGATPTLNVSGLGAKNLAYVLDGAAVQLPANTLIANVECLCVYDGTNIIVLAGGFTLFSTNAGTTGGTSTVYTATPTPAWAAYRTGVPFSVIFNQTNGATPTLNVSGLGAKNLVNGSGVQLAANSLVAGKECLCVYDGTSIVVLAGGIYGAALDDIKTLGTTGGTSTAYTISPSIAWLAYRTGMTFVVTFNQTNGASPTLNVSSLGAKNLIGVDGAAILTGTLPANQEVLCYYDGTSIVVTSGNRAPLNSNSRVPWANIPRVVCSCTEAGNVYSITLPDAPASYDDVHFLSFQAPATCTATPQVKINGGTQENLYDSQGNPLPAGAIIINQCYGIFRDSGNDGWRIVNPSLLPGPIFVDGTVPGAKLVGGSVSQTQLASSAVHQGQVAVTTQQQSGSLGNNLATTIVLTGGLYSFMATLAFANGGNSAYLAPQFGAGGYVSNFGFFNGTGSSSTYWFQCQYISSSPPHDLGDGVIYLFIFLVVDRAGKVLRADTCLDPPWLHNGPRRSDLHNHPLFAQMQKEGCLFIPKKPRNNSVGEWKKYLNGLKSGDSFDREKFPDDPQKLKHQNMPHVPHPWCGDTIPDGCRVVMVDPVSDIAEQLALLHAMNERGQTPSELLVSEDSPFVIGNEPLKRFGPPGVSVVGLKWKNSN